MASWRGLVRSGSGIGRLTLRAGRRDESRRGRHECLRHVVVVALFAAVAVAQPSRYFVIQIVDDQTGRGVPLVSLTTINDATWWTDSNGIVSFDEPGLIGHEVFFHIVSSGYEAPDAGFG